MKRLLVLVLAAGVVALPAPVHAAVDVGDDLHTEYDACIAKITNTGLRKVVDQLDRSKHVFKIRKSAGTITNPSDEDDAANGDGTGGTTKWNPTDTTPFEGDGVANDGCATLYHEMQHWADYDTGTSRRDTCRVMENGKEKDTGIRVSEVKATREENRYRDAQTPKLPRRTHYGKDKPLPPEGQECLPAPPPPPPRGGCSAGCAIGSGDPHLKTFDDLHYDFQAVGEFVLTRATSGDLQVQGRTGAVAGVRHASLFTAVAANVAGDRVGVYRKPAGLTLRVAGAEVPVVAGTRPLPKGGTVNINGPFALTVTWPDGSAMDVSTAGTIAITVLVQLSDVHRGKVEGIFGNDDGKPGNDLVVRGGAALGEKPTFTQLYPSYADSWRVTQATSLFDYQSGQNTDTFTDRTFPDKPIVASELPNRVTAEAVCRRAGITDPVALEDCIVDVGLTGDPGLARAAVTTQQLFATAGTALLTIAAPGDTAQLTFAGTAGQKVFIDVPASTLPDQCFPLELRDPGGQLLRPGCIINGNGYIDGTVLPATGQYTLRLDPGGQTTGQARVRVITAVDQKLTVTPGGPEVTSTIGQPGAVTELRFTGIAGQKVFLDVLSSTLPDQCFPLELRDAANKLLRSGCIIGGAGYLDTTTLPAAGEYRLLVDPGDRMTGVSQLRLLSITDQIGTIAINGPPMTATIGLPGTAARFTFSGIAGQKVTLNVTESTIRDACFPLELLDPAGKHLRSGCIIGGAGGIPATTLPATGQYTIVLDPAGSNDGTAVLRLHT